MTTAEPSSPPRTTATDLPLYAEASATVPAKKLPDSTKARRATLSRRLRSLEIWIPAAVLGTIVAAAVLAPLLGILDPNAQTLQDRNVSILSDGHLLGTDNLGRDLLSRVLYGARVSLVVGFTSVLIGLTVGGLIGIFAGYKGGKIDMLMMRVLEIIMAFPALVLALTISVYLGPSVRNVIIAISFFTVPAYARIARATTLSLAQRDFIKASELIGASVPHVMFRHLAPNVAVSLLAYGFVAIGTAIVVEASLSFLGLGIQPPQPSWGIMIAQGRGQLSQAPHQVIVPGAFLFATVLSLNLLGDAVRSRLNRQVGTL